MFKKGELGKAVKMDVECLCSAFEGMGKAIADQDAVLDPEIWEGY